MGSQGRDTVSSIPLLGLFIQWYIWALKDTVAHRKKKNTCLLVAGETIWWMSMLGKFYSVIFLGRLLDDSSSAQLQHHHSASTYACQSLLGVTEVVDT